MKLHEDIEAENFFLSKDGSVKKDQLIQVYPSKNCKVLGIEENFRDTAPDSPNDRFARSNIFGMIFGGIFKFGYAWYVRTC